MKWLGMHSDTTPVDDRPGSAELIENGRMTIDGEMRRRTGMAATNVAKQAGPVLNIAPPLGPYGGLVAFVGGGLYGFQNPLPDWSDVAPEFPEQTGGASTSGTVVYRDYAVIIIRQPRRAMLLVLVATGGSHGGGHPHFPDNGHQFVVVVDGTVLLTSGVIGVGSTSVAIPATATQINLTVTVGGLNPAGTGTWTYRLTTP